MPERIVCHGFRGLLDELDDCLVVEYGHSVGPCDGPGPRSRVSTREPLGLGRDAAVLDSSQGPDGEAPPVHGVASVREAAVIGRYWGVRGVESQNQAMAFAVRKGPSAKTR